MMTGDASINEGAPIVCCTAEVLSQMALRLGADTPFTGVVMDEFHYYADRDRGMAWQIPLLTLPRSQFLLMSATLGDTEAIEEDLKQRTGRPAKSVSSTVRPVPLDFHYSETAIHETLSRLVRGASAPVYVVHFAQRSAAELAQALLSTDFCTPEEKAAVANAIKGFRFDSPYGAEMRRLLVHGVGIHHAGLLPKYRLLVEKLSQQGLLKVICGTDTLGVGINVPIRTVLFTQLCKFDGEKTDILSVRDFHQIAGRAGRKGFDDKGLVVVQAPDWVIENKRLEEASESGQRNKKKFVRRKPPDKGYKHWDRETFDRLVSRAPETLVSRFTVDHGLVLTLLQKGDETGIDGFQELLELVERSHEPKKSKERLREQATKLRDALLQVGILQKDESGRLRVATGLQRDFSLHHSLSLYLVHALQKLEADATALETISLVESILENPMPVLVAQVNREKGELVAAMKAQGVPYEERMEALEEVSWPKPRAEWTYATFNAFAETHPWVALEHIRPKGVVREMVEQFVGFADYVKGLRIERAEGVLLRYLTQAYKTLQQNVPQPQRTPDLYEAIGFLRAMLGRVDDSLVTEWEKLAATPGGGPERPADISSDPKTFRARIRAELHALVRALAVGDYEEAALSVRQVEGAEWRADDFQAALSPYLEIYGKVVFDGRSRFAWNTVVEDTGPHRWRVSQVLVDDQDDNAWSIDGVVDLQSDTDPSGPIVQVVRIGE